MPNMGEPIKILRSVSCIQQHQTSVNPAKFYCGLQAYSNTKQVWTLQNSTLGCKYTASHKNQVWTPENLYTCVYNNQNTSVTLQMSTAIYRHFSYTYCSFDFNCIWAATWDIKCTFWHVRSMKTQISLRMRTTWSEFSLSAWRNVASLAIQNAPGEDSDQTARIWIFAGRTCLKKHFATLRLIHFLYHQHYRFQFHQLSFDFCA